MRFADPLFLLLLSVPVLLQIRRAVGEPRGAPFPSTGAATGLPRSLRQRLVGLVPALRLAAMVLVILAIARPQYGTRVSSVEREGIAIGLVLDISTSMSALDLEIDGEARDRLAVARHAIRGFIRGGDAAEDGAEEAGARDGDAISLVTFARFATAISPPTLDHAALLSLLDGVRLVDDPEGDGTAIGDAIMLAIDRLRDAGDAGRVIILLTDGSHNAGAAEPLVAAEIARSLGIRVYTIGAGTKGTALMPTPNRDGGIDYRPAQVFIDEFVLEKIAETTAAKYFRATDGRMLAEIYAQIDALEKGRNVISFHQQYREMYPLFVIAALVLLVMEASLSATWLRVSP